MSDNRLVLAANVRAAARKADYSLILDELADHLNGTAGEFTDKALAEIAYAYMAGRIDESLSLGFTPTDLRQAVKLLMPLIPAIGRVK